MQVVREDASGAESLGGGEMSVAQSALGQLLTRANTIEINMAISAAGQQVKDSPRSSCSRRKASTPAAFSTRWATADLQQEIFTLHRQRRHSRSSPGAGSGPAARLAARARPRLRRTSVPVARRCHRPTLSREPASQTCDSRSLEQRHHRVLQDFRPPDGSQAGHRRTRADASSFVAASSTCPARCGET